MIPFLLLLLFFTKRIDCKSKFVASIVSNLLLKYAEICEKKLMHLIRVRLNSLQSGRWGGWKKIIRPPRVLTTTPRNHSILFYMVSFEALGPPFRTPCCKVEWKSLQEISCKIKFLTEGGWKTFSSKQNLFLHERVFLKLFFYINVTIV